MKRISYILIIALLGLFACNPSGEKIAEEIEFPGVVHTIWTEKADLFVEFPALVVGKASRFAAHFTTLKDHQPVRKGKVRVTLITNNGKQKVEVIDPASPGIFKPEITPKKAGKGDLLFELETGGLKDQMIIKNVQVYASEAEAIKALADEEEDGGISFLKEQAWKIKFHTEPVRKGEVFDIINSAGTWQYGPKQSQKIVASANGTLHYAEAYATEGMFVRKGQVLFRINGEHLMNNNTKLQLEKARSDYQQAKQEFVRKEKLYKQEIISQADYELVKNKYEKQKLNFENYERNYTRLGKSILAPADGYIKSLRLSEGDFAQEGEVLAELLSIKDNILKLDVSPSYNLSKQSIQNIHFQTASNTWSDLQSSEGKILSVSPSVNAEKPLISIYAKVNETVRMPNGAFTEAQIALGQARTSLLVPEQALLESYGYYSVMVQTGGESFENRQIRIGRRNGKMVEVLSGLNEGEIIVSEGAYQVKMASMSGTTPVHGHDH